MPTFFNLKPKDILLSTCLFVICAGCEKASVIDSQKAGSHLQTSGSPTSGTSIYRYLSAIAEAYPNKDELTNLCIRKHGFRLQLPEANIKTAHDIRLPASEEWIENQQVERQVYKTIIVQPPSVNGIIMKPLEKQVPYTVTENQEVRRTISGVCIGTEYILE